MSNRYGVFAGTFDPVHAGHVAFAQAAAQCHGLKKVYFLPEANPRHKPAATTLQHRLNMLQRATDSSDVLDVLQPPHADLTIAKSLPWLQHHLGEKFHLLLGSDVALALHQWPGIDDLLRTVEVSIGLRSGDSEQEIQKALMPLPRGTFHFISTPHLHHRSRDVRGAQSEALPILRSYILKHGLYAS